MNISFINVMTHQDPMGLKDLPLLQADSDGWPAIQAALEQQQASRLRWRTTTSWLAVAASLVLAVLLSTRQADFEPLPVDPVATQNPDLASVDSMDSVESLISLSQTLESQLRNLRDETGSIPASSVVYIAELQDLVAQVDSELSNSPDSVNLWAQRINLLLDLAQIYQHHWETEYGQMASL